MRCRVITDYTAEMYLRVCRVELYSGDSGGRKHRRQPYFRSKMRSVLVTYFDNTMLMRPDYVTALQPKCVRMLFVRNALFEGYRCQEVFDNTAAGYICCGILRLLSFTNLTGSVHI